VTAEDQGAQAAGLLVDQALEALLAGRNREALSAASRAVEAAEHFDDLVLLVRALVIEADILNLTGDAAAALSRYTRILGLGQDPASAHRLDDPRADESVARAHWSWVAAARYLTSIPLRDLFGVLDAGERWLAATGHLDWRAAILSERAALHSRLGEYDAAVAAAQEALQQDIRHPEAPGYSLLSYYYDLGDHLFDAGRAEEARQQYLTVLGHPDCDPWSRCRAHLGLAECALAASDLATARREARAAVQIGEPLGDDERCKSLHVLVKACRAAGDLDTAWKATTTWLEAAARIGDHYRPYQAVSSAADLALDRADIAAAHRLLEELAPHARAMDTTTGTSEHADAAARLRQRLAELTEAGDR
jgi:tetratricopeptide (TPR) repeat protein